MQLWIGVMTYLNQIYRKSDFADVYPVLIADGQEPTAEVIYK